MIFELLLLDSGAPTASLAERVDAASENEMGCGCDS